MKMKTLYTQRIILWSSILVFPTLLFAANTNDMVLFTGVNLLILLLSFLTVFLIYKVRKNAKTLDKLRKELKHLSRTDDLTQMFNRRYLEKRLYEVFERHIRNKSSNSVLLMVSLDNFRSTLNNKGQSAADLLVQNTAGVIQERVRNTDLCGRFSEDTFLVLLRDTTTKPAQKLAEEVRSKLQDTELLYGQIKLDTTCSLGLAAYSSDMVSCRDWIQQVDQALNKAKQLGGNQTTVC
jgi:diguanylate cyclase (GGDEF)-like protein